MTKELKEFLFKTNVPNLVVAVVIGAAFNTIIASPVEDVITPLFLNPALGTADVEKIAELSWHGVAYGSFLSTAINFLIIGATLFLIVKAANATSTLSKKRNEVEGETAPTQEELLIEIRDLLKEK